jgi:hypothetical protein
MQLCQDKSRLFSAGEVIPSLAGTVIIGKIGALAVQERAQRWIEEIAKAKERGAYCYLDYTDNHLGFESVMRPFYIDVLKMIDGVICPSEHMATLITPYTKKPISIIPDAIEIPTTKPKDSPQEPRRMMWFGHPSNLSYLMHFLERRLPPIAVSWAQKLELLILTDQQGLQLIQNHNPKLPKNLKMQIAPWSVANMSAAAACSDLCIIPGDPSDPRKSGVSANRLITALALGLPTAADDLGSYVPYRAYYTSLGDPQFENLLADPVGAHKLITQAQVEIVPKYYPENIQKQWQAII